MFDVPDFTHRFDLEWDQERYSRARFNANANRRVAYRLTLATPQRKLHMDPTFGAFMSEKVLGCPAGWADVEHTRDFIEENWYGNQS